MNQPKASGRQSPLLFWSRLSFSGGSFDFTLTVDPGYLIHDKFRFLSVLFVAPFGFAISQPYHVSPVGDLLFPRLFTHDRLLIHSTYVEVEKFGIVPFSGFAGDCSGARLPFSRAAARSNLHVRRNSMEPT
jgi:hypothetical protein